jgi:hypothetical protein
VASMKSEGDEPLVGSQQPRIRVTPEAPANDAADLIDLAADYGLVLDPWQCEVFKAGLGLESGEPGARWSSDTVCTAASRQSGKGACLEALLLAAVFLFEEQVVACSAHEARTTRLSFERMLGYVENYDDLRKRVSSVQRWVGREQIRFRSGQLVVFPARSRGALRGYSIDRLILDEAQYLTGAQFEAVLPTLSARPNTQTWLFGTPPTHVGDGEVFTRLRAQALSGKSERLTWLEWSAEPGCDLDDRQMWAMANPALGRRISVEAIAAERAALSDEGFRRERLGIFDVDQSADHVFGSPEAWEVLAATRRDDIGAATAVGVDRSSDGLVCVTAAYRDFDTGSTHVEVAYVRDQVASMAPAVNWLVANVPRRTPIIIDSRGPAGPAITLLANARRPAVIADTQEAIRAAIGLSDDVAAGVLTHADANGVLAQAVGGARKRPIGDAGGWGWDRRDGSVAVSPLVAASLAHYGALAHGRRQNRVRGAGRSSEGRRGFVM